MQKIDDRLVLSPTDLTKHLACAHVTTLDLLALDTPSQPVPADDALALVLDKGISHEKSFLDSLVEEGKSVVEIPPAFNAAGRREAERLTVEAMRRGVDVIYQATFFDTEWGGQADFLLRTDAPSDLGAWSYDIADTKLARHLKVPALDEAGQFSLANAVAVAQAGSSLVLLGDPQQLAQPTQAQHADGADASALGHLLEGHDTMPPDRGIFLDTSWRMHPEITAFVSELAYEGRLSSARDRSRQRITARGRLDGNGLRFEPVEHAGNAAGSDEKVRVVAELVSDLLTGRWTDHLGEQHPLTLAEILVVSPYNNQVGRLRSALPEGARVGTVDKFQGQEAPVVIYSMASSSAEDAPRGVGFLYDLHRLNVALSRARALTAVVASPRLLDGAVRTPEQLRKVNALCRYAEVARGSLGSAEGNG